MGEIGCAAMAGERCRGGVMCRVIHRSVCGLMRDSDCVVEQSIGTATAKSVFYPADPAKEHA
jgi:hypothetical protein